MSDELRKEWQLAPNDVKDYTADYTKELTRLGDSIVSAHWIVPSRSTDNPGDLFVLLDATVGPDYDTPDASVVFSHAGVSTSTMKSTIFLKGAGPLDTLFTVKNVAVTASGRTLSMEFFLRAGEKRPLA